MSYLENSPRKRTNVRMLSDLPSPYIPNKDVITDVLSIPRGHRSQKIPLKTTEENYKEDHLFGLFTVCTCSYNVMPKAELFDNHSIPLASIYRQTTEPITPETQNVFKPRIRPTD